MKTLILAQVFFVTVPPERIVPDQRFSGGARTKLPLVEIRQQSKKLRPVFTWRISCRHFAPLQPLRTTEDVDKVIGADEIQRGGDLRLRVTGDVNKFDLAGSPVLHNRTCPFGEHNSVSGRVKYIGQPRAGSVERERFWEIGCRNRKVLRNIFHPAPGHIPRLVEAKDRAIKVCRIEFVDHDGRSSPLWAGSLAGNRKGNKTAATCMGNAKPRLAHSADGFAVGQTPAG